VQQNIALFLFEAVDAEYCGNPSGPERIEINMPDENSVGIRIYVDWLYTGHIFSSISAEELWKLGHRLGST
jgi:hypothetical protein